MMNKIFLTLGIALAVILLPTLLSSCAAMGTNPNKEDQKKFQDSPQFFSQSETFDNTIPHLQDSVRAQMSVPGLLWDNLWAKNNTPDNLLPQIKPNLQEFIKAAPQIKSIWLGHSSFLLNVDGKMVLLDPVFGEEASPVFFAVNRFQDPVLSLEELPPIDIIVISHDHYDHLDIETVEFFKDKSTQFVTPLGVGSHLRGWGVKADLIHERDWWQEVVIDSIQFTAAPSQHFSGRSLSSNRTLWASWVIQSQSQRIYFSGDTGYSPHFKEIGEKLGPFDFAYLECGQYNLAWRQMHLLPDEIVQAYNDLGVTQAQPIHWGMFDLSLNAWDLPIKEIYARHQKGLINIVTPKIGEAILLGEPYENKTWWRDVD